MTGRRSVDPGGLPFTCSCCGYVHDLYDRDAEDSCPICHWVEVPAHVRNPYDTLWFGRNWSLWQAQLDFAVHGACNEDPGLRELVRAPRAREHRDPLWTPLVDQLATERERVDQLLVEAFGDLTRGAGMRVFDAVVADDWGIVHDHARAIEHVDYQHWWDVPDELIEGYDAVLSFFDAPAFRFHFPAYARWSMVHLNGSDSITSDSLIYNLEAGGRGADSYRRVRFEAFDRPQSEAVARFLQVVVAFSTDLDHEAQAALDHYWGSFL